MQMLYDSAICRQIQNVQWIQQTSPSHSNHNDQGQNSGHIMVQENTVTVIHHLASAKEAQCMVLCAKKIIDNPFAI